MGNSGSIVKCDYLADRNVFEKSSYFQSQIQLEPVEWDQFEAHSINEFMDLIPKCDAVDQTFDMEKLPYSVSRRFIELLPSATLYFFTTTSRRNYRQCLDLRGLEYSFFHVDSFTNCSHDGEETKLCGLTGRREGETCIHEFDHKWINFFLTRDVLSFALYSKNVDIPLFLKTYKTLNLTFEKDTFVHNYRQAADKLIHPSLDVLQVIISVCEELHQSPIPLKHFAEFLELCKTVKKIEVDFDSCLLEEGTTLASIRSAIEYWASRSPTLELFLFSYNKSEYKLDRGQLKVILKLGNEWFICSGYNDARITALALPDQIYEEVRNYPFPDLTAYLPMSSDEILECQRLSSGNKSQPLKNNFRMVPK